VSDVSGSSGLPRDPDVKDVGHAVLVSSDIILDVPNRHCRGGGDKAIKISFVYGQLIWALHRASSIEHGSKVDSY
jgi:hypothetical protein